MEPAALSPLVAWESFYVIVGSSAAALTGLQFVVIVLGAEVNALGGGSATHTFGTPTVLHFCAVLLMSAILSAPWARLASVGLALGACAVAGTTYVIVIIKRMRRQTHYQPVVEDWVWHCVLPLIAYVALLVAVVVLPSHPAPSLFGIAGTALLLLFVGIHNAWDAVTYIAHERRQRPE
jgi:hypothetical protein